MLPCRRDSPYNRALLVKNKKNAETPQIFSINICGCRLEESQGKLREVERDREHWRLELQLLQIKLEKQKVQPEHQEIKLEVSKGKLHP